MWDDFLSNRTASLAQLPTLLDPALIAQYYDTGSETASTYSTGPTTTTTTAATAKTTSSSSGPMRDPNMLAATLSGALSTDAPPSAVGGDSWGSKYGTAVLVLLCVILVLHIALLTVIAVRMCVCRRKEKRRSGSGSGSSGGVGPHYDPVQLKEPVEDYGHSSESVTSD